MKVSLIFAQIFFYSIKERVANHKATVIIGIAFLALSYLSYAVYRHRSKTQSFNDKLLFQQGKYNQALDEYNVKLVKNPKDIKALNGKAKALYKLKNFDEAKLTYKASLKEELQNLEALTGIAKIADKQNKNSESEWTLVRQACKEKGHSALDLANTYYALGEIDQALQYYREEASNPDALVAMARILYTQEKIEEGEKFSKKACQIECLNPKALTIHACYLEEKGETQNAIQYLENSRKINPNQNKVLLGLILLYQKVGRWEDAWAIYQEYDRGNPDQTKISMNLAEVCYQQAKVLHANKGDAGKISELCGQAVKNYKKTFDWMKNLNEFEKTKKIQFMQNILELDKDNSEVQKFYEEFAANLS